jgi:hypothetical protein
MRHGACLSSSSVRSVRLASLVALVLALSAIDARAEDDPRAAMARALEEQADVEPPPAILPVRAPLDVPPGRSGAPPASTGLARAAEMAAENARGLAQALAHATRAAWAASDAAAEQAVKARGRGNERPGRGLKR